MENYPYQLNITHVLEVWTITISAVEFTSSCVLNQKGILKTKYDTYYHISDMIPVDFLHV